MRITVDLAKASTEPIDLTKTLNPRVGDGDLKLPLHIIYDQADYDMRGKSMDFLSEGSDQKKIYVSGTTDESSTGDDAYTGNVTFTFPTGTFKTAGTYDVDKTMFRIVDNEGNVISSVNVKMNVLPNDADETSSDDISYDTRMENVVKDFTAKGQSSLDDAKKQAQQLIDDTKQQANDYLNNAKKQSDTLLDEIKQTNAEAKGNVSGDTAATATQAKQQSIDNSGKIHDLQGEVGDARGRFMTLSDRENKQDFNIDRKEDKDNANANYAAQDKRNDAQDIEIAKKANQNFITDYLSQMYLQPEGFENEAALKAKYPDGKPGIMVTVDTGHKWIYANGQWNDCGVYQSAGFTDDQNQTFNNALRGQAFIYDHSQVVPPYDDLNTLPANTTVSYMVGNGHTIKNTPDQRDDYTVITIGPRDRTKITGSVQVAVRFPDVVWTRMYWSDWGDWMRISSFGTKNANIYDDKTLVAPYDDLNTLPLGTSVTYSYGYDKVKNSPNIYGPFTVSTLAGEESITTASQIAVTDSGICYVRFGTSSWVRLAEYHKNINISSEEQAKSLGYDDLNNLPNNATVMYSIQSSLLKNSPISAKDSIEVNTIAHDDDSKYGRTQEAYNLTTGEHYTRLLNGDVITDWKQVATVDMLDKRINISSEEQATSLGYDDLNNLPNNATVMYSIQSSLLKNSPISAKDSIEVITVSQSNNSKYGRTQEAYNLTTGERYTRLLNGDVITDWEKVITSDMLDLSNLNDKANLPSLSMFGKFAVVGDSY